VYLATWAGSWRTWTPPQSTRWVVSAPGPVLANSMYLTLFVVLLMTCALSHATQPAALTTSLSWHSMKMTWEYFLHRPWIRVSFDAAPVEDEAGVLVHIVVAALRRHHVVLAGDGPPHPDAATLEDRLRVSEYKIHGPVYVRLQVHLDSKYDGPLEFDLKATACLPFGSASLRIVRFWAKKPSARTSACMHNKIKC
jgi:hypothetical protein